MTLEPPPACEITAKIASYALDCGFCRMLAARADVPLKLVAAGRGVTPIDRIKFRCRSVAEEGCGRDSGEHDATGGFSDMTQEASLAVLESRQRAAAPPRGCRLTRSLIQCLSCESPAGPASFAIGVHSYMTTCARAPWPNQTLQDREGRVMLQTAVGGKKPPRGHALKTGHWAVGSSNGQGPVAEKTQEGKSAPEACDTIATPGV